MGNVFLETLNDTIDHVSKYLGVELCAKHGIPETKPVDEAEAAQRLIQLYEVLKLNVENMEGELKLMRNNASFEVQVAVAKEIRQRENLQGEIDAMISKLQNKDV
jgi:predicted FMN-binding regulatory protein PaiB